MPNLAIHQRFLQYLSDKSNCLRTIKMTQATIALPIAPTENYGGFTWYKPFAFSDASEGSYNRNYIYTEWNDLHSRCSEEFQQQLWTFYKALYGQQADESTMITDVITDIITDMITSLMDYWRAELKIVEQWSQILLQFLKGSLITPEYSKVASRYNSQLPLSINTIPTWSDDWTEWLTGVRAICANFVSISQRSQWKRIANERIWMAP